MRPLVITRVSTVAVVLVDPSSPETSTVVEVYPVCVARIKHARVRKGSTSIRHVYSPFLSVRGPGADPWRSLQIRSMPTLNGGGDPSGIVTLPFTMSG